MPKANAKVTPASAPEAPRGEEYKAGDDVRTYLRRYGYPDAFIDQHVAGLEAKLQASVERKTNGRTLSTADVQARTPVATTVSIPTPSTRTETMATTQTTTAPKTAPASNGKPKAKAVAATKRTPKADAGPRDPATAEIRWSEKKVELLKALKKAGAVSPATAIPADKIAKVSGGKALTSLDPKYDVTAQGFIAVATSEEAGTVRYVTKKGLKKLEELLGK